jgi:hypothetical protein
VDLADVADELYGVPPEDFVAARTAARDQAKAAGDKHLAAQIAALPKPATAAWVCNLLVRGQRDEIAQLVELGGMMRQAQRTLSGEQMKELGRQRSQVVAALTRQARALAHQHGHDVSSAIAEQVEGTLRAAVADADAGAALLGGRLTSPLSYTGLGPVDLDGAVATLDSSGAGAAVIPQKAPAPGRTGPAGKAGRRDAAARSDAAAREAERRQQEEERRRREAEEQRRRELAQAERDAEEAEAVARDTAAAAQTAERRTEDARSLEEELRTRVAELEQELRRTRQRVTRAATDLQEAQRRSDAATRRAQTAAAIRDRARARADQLRSASS